MIPLLLAAGLAAPPDPGWRLADEPTFAGRSAVGYYIIELSDRPSRPLHRDDAPPAGARFGSVPLAGGAVRLPAVWHPASAAVWIDADADGRFTQSERHVLGPTALAVAVRLPDLRGPRTLLVRRQGDGLAAGVRGFTAGSTVLAGRTVKAALTDGDGDGQFDAAGADRVWLDLDADGTLDPLTEQFPLGTAILHNGSAFLVRPRADGLGLTVRERPAESGQLTVDIPKLPGATVAELAVQYVSEWGELVVARSAGEPLPVPAGRYRVEGVRLKLLAADGKLWAYTFSPGDRGGWAVAVPKGGAVTHAPLAGLVAQAATDPAGPIAPGDRVQVYPVVQAGHLYLTACEAGDRYAEHGIEVLAETELAGPGSVTLDRFSSGFA